ncbi:MAG: hypothetical protein ACREBF_03810 [Candidatus Micrarchaeales archaeon]
MKDAIKTKRSENPQIKSQALPFHRDLRDKTLIDKQVKATVLLQLEFGFQETMLNFFIKNATSKAVSIGEIEDILQPDYKKSKCVDREMERLVHSFIFQLVGRGILQETSTFYMGRGVLAYKLNADIKMELDGKEIFKNGMRVE